MRDDGVSEESQKVQVHGPQGRSQAKQAGTTPNKAASADE